MSNNLSRGKVWWPDAGMHRVGRPRWDCRLGYTDFVINATEKFLAKFDAIQAPAKFAADEGVFRTHIPVAINDLETLVAACSGSDRRAIIDAMWAFAHEMIPDVTDALDDVDPSVVHLDPHNG